jgi:hypothetical protein
MFLYKFTDNLPIRTHSGLTVATNYSRIVYGGRGAYVEFSPFQMVEAALHATNIKHYYYTEFRTLDGIMVYLQKHCVNYADYLINKYYITPTALQNFERTQNRYRIVES